jgi:hypothetical protein
MMSLSQLDQMAQAAALDLLHRQILRAAEPRLPPADDIAGLRSSLAGGGASFASSAASARAAALRFLSLTV